MGRPAYTEHDTILNSVWRFQVWDADAVGEYLAQAGSRLLDRLDRLAAEWYNARDGRGTVPRGAGGRAPGLGKAVLPLKTRTVRNRLVDTGLAELARRGTGESVSSESHHAIGTGSSATEQDDEALDAEVARKAVASRGSDGGTGRYATAFVPGDIASLAAAGTLDITEASLQTGARDAAGDVMVVRVVTDPIPMSAGRLVTASTHITYRNGAG